MIIGVAIKYGDLLIGLPKLNRYHHVIKYMLEVLCIHPPIGHQYKDEQGFNLEDGAYLNRIPAHAYTQETGQCTTFLPTAENYSVKIYGE